MAQRQFYDLFKKLVFSIVMRYAKDVPEAEDIMQDAFVKLYRDLYQYQPTNALGAWVRRVTVNTALMHVRKKRMLFSDVEQHNFAEKIMICDLADLQNIKDRNKITHLIIDQSFAFEKICFNNMLEISK